MSLQTDWDRLGTLDAIELFSQIELTLLTEPITRERMNALQAVDGALRHLFKDTSPSLQKMAHCS